MNKKTAIYLSAASLLILVIIVILAIRRRGRKEGENPMSGGASISQISRSNFGKKVELTDSAKEKVIAIWYNDFQNYYYFDKTLRYVIVPKDAEKEIDEDGYLFTEIVAVGHLLPSGKLKRTVLSGKTFIANAVLQNN